MSGEAPKRTIRFEDLGAPIQRLFKSMAGKISEDDMALVQEYVSVKDMAKIFQELGSDRGAEAIWADLREALLQRKEKQLAKQRELSSREDELSAMRAQQEADDAEEERQRQEEAEKAAKKADKRRKKAEAAAAAAAEEEERQRLEAEAAEAERLEQERLAEEAARAEEKKRKKEEKRKKLEEEEARLAKQKADEAGAKSRNQKKEWEDFVASHPLEYSESAIQDIVQKPKAPEDGLAPRATLAASADLLNRTWTPYCPHCHAKYSKPPPEWDCSMCLRKFRQHVKCWQPDDKAPNCAICKKSVGRFTRHHCRNCGRVVCGPCSEFQAKITSIGYNTPVKVCRQCVDELGTVTTPAAAAASS